MIVTLEHVTRRFGGVTALDDVSVELRSGAIVGLIGPNGSGKTTLTDVISGFARPSSGRILVDGVDITRTPASRVARSGITRTFQTPRVLPTSSVRDHLEAAKPAPGGVELAAEFVQRWMRDVGADAPASSLDLLTVRTMEIASRLRLAPRLLLLDEPAAGLTGQEQDQLCGLVSWLAERGIGIVIIEHSMHVIFRLASRVIVLADGVVIAHGEPRQVASDPHVVERYLGIDFDADEVLT